jgi:hypothetical protein
MSPNTRVQRALFRLASSRAAVPPPVRRRDGMNRYLRSGGRIVAIVALIAGVIACVAAFVALIDALPFAMVRGALPDPVSQDSAWRDLEFACACVIFAFLCFRYRSRLRREERQGVQI